MSTDTKLAEVMALAREAGNVERRACIGKAQGFDVRDAYAALESAVAGILDALEAAQAALRWYRDEAAALAKHMSDGAHTQAVLASVTVLSLDAGRRADAALSETQPSSNAIRPDDPSPGSWVKGEQP